MSLADWLGPKVGGRFAPLDAVAILEFCPLLFCSGLSSDYN